MALMGMCNRDYGVDVKKRTKRQPTASSALRLMVFAAQSTGRVCGCPAAAALSRRRVELAAEREQQKFRATAAWMNMAILYFDATRRGEGESVCVGLEAQSPTGVSDGLGHVPPLWQDLFGGFLLFALRLAARVRLQLSPFALLPPRPQHRGNRYSHGTTSSVAIAGRLLPTRSHFGSTAKVGRTPSARLPAPAILDTSVAAQANGSSRITLGGTEIFCGIKAEVRSFGDDSDDEDEEAEFQTQDDQELAAEGRKTGRIKCSVD